MLTGHGSFDTAIQSIRMGAFDYVVKPCPLDELQVRIQRTTERQALRRRTHLLERGLTPPDLGSSFVGNGPEFRRMLQLIERVAPSDSTVLITGETGSGKEMVAKLEPQVVLLDLQLPDLSGLQVLERLHERCPAAEVIMLTGHGSFDTAIQSQNI